MNVDGISFLAKLLTFISCLRLTSCLPAVAMFAPRATVRITLAETLAGLPTMSATVAIIVLTVASIFSAHFQDRDTVWRQLEAHSTIITSSHSLVMLCDSATADGVSGVGWRGEVSQVGRGT